MRIVQIANFYAPTSGGLKIVVEETGRGFRQAGHERILIVPGRKDSVEHTATGRRVVVRSLRLPGLGNYRILINRWRIRRLLTEESPDIVEVSDKFSLGWLSRWCRRNGVPIVLFSHERIDAILRPRMPRWFPLRRAADLANRRLSRQADKVVVTSAFSAAEFERIGATNLRRIRLGVDLDTFRPSTGPAATVPAPWMSAEPDAVRLITISRLSCEKRPERSIETLRVLRSWGVPAHLVMVGDGPQLERLRRQSEGLPVTFLRHVSDRRVLAELIAGADLALSPSPAETFGLATLEALACGTPVVVPADGAARELLDGPGCGAVSDGTPQDTARAVREVLAVPEQERRKAARAAAERYPWRATVDGLLRAYEELSGVPRVEAPRLDVEREPAG
jgi:alpha-1,6-mannosyltransferase